MNSTIKALVPALALASLAMAGTEAHRQFTENAIKSQGTVDKPNNRAVVGKGAQMQIFSIQQSRTPTTITVTATQTSGAGQGRVASLTYNLTTETMAISGGGKQITLSINKDNTVTIGATKCQGKDVPCIANAVIAGVPFQPQEIAAMLMVVNDDLHSTPNGDYVASAMLQIMGQLNKMANPRPPAKTK